MLASVESANSKSSSNLRFNDTFCKFIAAMFSLHSSTSRVGFHEFIDINKDGLYILKKLGDCS